MTSETQRQFERKWVIGIESAFGPREELVSLIPRIFNDEEDWWFVQSIKGAVPQSRVFDTPQAAALGAIAANEAQIKILHNENIRLLNWFNQLEAAKDTNHVQR